MEKPADSSKCERCDAWRRVAEAARKCLYELRADPEMIRQLEAMGAKVRENHPASDAGVGLVAADALALELAEVKRRESVAFNALCGNLTPFKSTEKPVYPHWAHVSLLVSGVVAQNLLRGEERTRLLRELDQTRTDADDLLQRLADLQQAVMELHHDGATGCLDPYEAIADANDVRKRLWNECEGLRRALAETQGLLVVLEMLDRATTPAQWQALCDSGVVKHRSFENLVKARDALHAKGLLPSQEAL